MNRERFARLCLAVSIIGLGIMYFSTQFMEPRKVSISEISESDIGQSYRVEGQVTGFYTTESASFFTLENGSSSISVADFRKRSLSSGSEVVVMGQVDLYQGDLQIVSTEIEQE